MFDALRSLLYGTTPAAFASSYDLEESVERLCAITKASKGASFFNKPVGGTVSENYVCLTRLGPAPNSFKPCFIGKFERTAAGSVVLK
jgi:hypothetical protein